MGAYQSKPSKEKFSSYGGNEWIDFGVSSMQGWRMNQEDAHNCELEFDKLRHASLFAVYDGHGGSEVARYCAAYLPKFLRDLPAYGNQSDLSETLKQLFLDFDASLTTPETRNILRGMADSDRENPKSDDEGVQPNQEDDDGEDEDESDPEISLLRAEANQPLESVLERYGGEDALPSSIKDLLEYRRRTKVGECSTSSVGSSASTSATTTSRKAAEQKDGNIISLTEDLHKEESKVKNSEGDHETVSVKPDSRTITQSATVNKLEVFNNEGADQKNANLEVLKDEITHTNEHNDDDDESDDESVHLDEEEESSSDDDSDDEVDEDLEEDTSSSDGSMEDEEYQSACHLGIPTLLREEDSEPGVDSGTTACVAIVLPSNGAVRLYVANAGDSRAVLCRGRAAVDLSVDHKPEDEDEKARIQAAGGTVTRDGRVNGGLNLSRALGDHNYKQAKHLSLTDQMITPTPDVTQYDLIPGSDEFVVLACDGVWNSMTSQEVVDFVYKRLHPSTNTNNEQSEKLVNSIVEPDGDTTNLEEKEAARLSEICEEIFDHCLAPNTEGDGTGCDNMTCIIVRFKNLEALAKLTSTSDHAHVDSGAESRKRPATEVHQNNGSSANGITSVSTSETDLVQAKRPKVDSTGSADAVSNGN